MVDANSTLVLSELKCRKCGGDMWVKPKKDGSPMKYQKYCSKECQPYIEKVFAERNRRPIKHKILLKVIMPRVCNMCGDVYIPKGWKSGYCGEECREKRYQQKLEAAKKGSNKTALKCHECGSEYIPKQISKGIRGTKYCGRLCKQKAQHRKRQARPGWHNHKCKECGEDFTTKRTDSVYCSQSCKGIGAAKVRIPKISRLPKYSRVYHVKCPACGDKRMSRYDSDAPCCTPCGSVMVMRNKVSRDAETKNCKICNVLYSPIYPHRGRVCCSDECDKENDRIALRRGKSKRRALIRSSIAEGHELFDPVEVFIRDDWRCQSCGCETPKELRGTRNDDAPELDHVIPLSKGGMHSIDNTQCLCRVCNIMKSDMMQHEFNEWKQGDRGTRNP